MGEQSLALYFIFYAQSQPNLLGSFWRIVRQTTPPALLCVVTSGVFTTCECGERTENIPAVHLLCYSVQINRPYAHSPALRNCGIQCVRTTFSLATNSPSQGTPLQIEMTKGRSLEGEQKGPAELCLFYHTGQSTYTHKNSRERQPALASLVARCQNKCCFWRILNIP